MLTSLGLLSSSSSSCSHVPLMYCLDLSLHHCCHLVVFLCLHVVVSCFGTVCIGGRSNVVDSAGGANNWFTKPGFGGPFVGFPKENQHTQSSQNILQSGPQKSVRSDVSALALIPKILIHRFILCHFVLSDAARVSGHPRMRLGRRKRLKHLQVAKKGK